MFKFIKTLLLWLVGLVIFFAAVIIVTANPNVVELNLYTLQVSLPLGAIVIGSVSIGLVLGFFLDWMASFVRSKLQQRKVKKLESKIEKLSAQEA